ncbi:MAG: serine/threonine-protein kinase [Acidobacteriota bacterium]
MTANDRWQEIDRLLDAVLDVPADQREAALAAASDDPELRVEVARLLAAGDREETRLSPGGGFGGAVWESLARDLAEPEEELFSGHRVGRYRLVRELGRGGMAVVYLAERADGQFEQQVALKRIHGDLVSAELEQRFELERQILARVQHPGIAQLLDGGVDDEGHPYLVMEYVAGRPIDRYCDEQGLDLDQRLELFLQVARAVDHAHRNLVIHRDLKPSNILVTDDGHAKLLDFGIAKLTGDAGDGLALTRTDARVLTPIFASPEQVGGDPVTTASDLYQLGLLLFLLLTGRWPYPLRGAGAPEVIEAICHRPAKAPSQVLGEGADFDPPTVGPGPRPPADGAHRRRLTGDLDTIVLKALRKEPERRFRSAAQMVEDLERHRAGLPIGARPDTVRYRTGKWIRRHRGATATAVLALVMLVALATVYTWRLRSERDRARRSAAEATQTAELLRGLFEISAPTRSQGEQFTARQLLDRGALRLREELADQPDLQAEMLTLIGDVYGQLALYREARPLLIQATELRRDGPPAALAESLLALARVEMEEGDLAAARTKLESVLATERREHGDDHPRVAQVIDDLGRLERLAGNLPAARDRHRDAVARLTTALGDDAPEVARALKNLGIVLRELRAYGEAKPTLERALALLEKHYGPDHSYTVDARLYLGDALRFTGDSEGARRQYESALPRIERIYGPQHPEVALVLGKLGNLFNATGSSQAALAAHLRALQIREQAYGPLHPRVASSLNNLGLVSWKGESLDQARRYLERSLEVYESSLGEDHPEVVKALRNLAGVLKDSDDHAAALPLYERVVAIREQTYGSEHSLLSAPLFELGALHLELGAPTTAEPLLRRALSLGRNQEPHRHPEVIMPTIALGQCLGLLGRPREARRLLEAVIADDTVDDRLRQRAERALGELS